jgi:hypothetical protein
MVWILACFHVSVVTFTVATGHTCSSDEERRNMDIGLVEDLLERENLK